ncbi:uncharacterized protein K441DRAFT_697388 [Cenococcum geophilum 1.58]|uniref:uncharacterized protein n=1 Tax=Cenococcum geophilum 1.58 TaxID=794803 RepID=UPI00358F3123|nr:hypothetical protein K441DRAFT_697388 [Cenococcum geophilum 1.58]
MSAGNPQEAFEGLIKGSSKTRMSPQPANEGERRAGDGQSTTDDAADGCDDRTAGPGWSGVLQDLSDCGFAEGAGDAGESVAGDQIAGALCCGLKLRSGIVANDIKVLQGGWQGLSGGNLEFATSRCPTSDYSASQQKLSTKLTSQEPRTGPTGPTQDSSASYVCVRGFLRDSRS